MDAFLCGVAEAKVQVATPDTMATTQMIAAISPVMLVLNVPRNVEQGMPPPAAAAWARFGATAAADAAGAGSFMRLDMDSGLRLQLVGVAVVPADGHDLRHTADAVDAVDADDQVDRIGDQPVHGQLRRQQQPVDATTVKQAVGQAGLKRRRGNRTLTRQTRNIRRRRDAG
nr:hypothetical protein [uncultured Rhodopila sp.]